MNLNRELLKTVGGILIIGAILVAVFLNFGGDQRDQLNEEEPAAQEAAEEQAEQEARSEEGSSEAPAAGGVGGGTIPEAGGAVVFLTIPVATGVGLAHWQLLKRRKRYSL